VAKLGGTDPKPKRQNPEKTSVFPGSAVSFASVRVGEMLRQGFEPTPKNTGKRADSESGGAQGGAIGLESITEALAALPPDRLVALLAAAIQSKAATK
jgi:hypothetical protein